jgi:hypothetical protein
MKEIIMLNGYKTYLVAALIAVFGVLSQYDWNGFLNDPKAGWVALASAVLMAIMRAITQATTVQQALETDPPKPVKPTPAPAPKPVAKPTPKPTPKKK